MRFKFGLLIFYIIFIVLVSVVLTETKDSLHKDQKFSAAAGELLLELMIKIATYPNYWNKIEKLLGNLNSNMLPQRILDLRQEYKEKARFLIRKHATNTKSQNFSQMNTTGQWAPFHNWANGYSIYSKTFVYQKVTGKSNILDNNPKTYVAVSVIAPKQSSVKSKKNLSLERDLRILKYWTHQDNLKNVTFLSSRWFIKTA
ncbi:uncharacterized protein LOC135136237 isoform X2 [Zophobas morio]|uniref:uncharacterized protein LOC135136237 isoform X2 n=1 Tax=Zophobas morio TaxID=2755281 RepID=UPI003083859E